MNQVKTIKRIGLTGTPLQNHLPELYTMMEWVRPGFLPSKDKFHEAFELPVLKGAKDCGHTHLVVDTFNLPIVFSL